MRIGTITLLMLVGLYGAFPSAADAAEKDITVPRVPSDQIQAAKAMKNPLPSTPENIAKGKTIYEGNGLCGTCHGAGGKGDGDVGKALEPSPRNLTDPKFHQLRSDGEIFWVIKNGVGGTGMIPAVITEQEIWQVILYERTFKGK